jgi:hypothetical protein
MKSQYLAALPVFPYPVTNWNHPTILVSATSEFEARQIIAHLRPGAYIGRIEKQPPSHDPLHPRRKQSQ